MTRVANPRGQGDRLRADLIAAAERSLVSARALELPSLRSIAREAGVAASAVYLHFESVAALVDAVIVEKFADLRSRVDSGGGDIEARATAYVRWGVEHPGAYQLLFESADRLQAPAPGAPRPGWELIDDLVAVLEGTGLEPRTAAHAAVTLWTALHGITSLRIHKPDNEWPHSDKAAARLAVASLLAVVDRPSGAGAGSG